MNSWCSILPYEVRPWFIALWYDSFTPWLGFPEIIIAKIVQTTLYVPDSSPSCVAWMNSAALVSGHHDRWLSITTITGLSKCTVLTVYSQSSFLIQNLIDSNDALPCISLCTPGGFLLAWWIDRSKFQYWYFAGKPLWSNCALRSQYNFSGQWMKNYTTVVT